MSDVRKRYNEEQIIGFLQKAYAGVAIKRPAPSAPILKGELLRLVQRRSR
jgi:hypothetical protein